MSYEQCTSLDVFISLHALSDFKKCSPKPILKSKPTGPLIRGKQVTAKYMGWTETLILHDNVLYLPCVWKDRATIILKLLVLALSYDPTVTQVGVVTKKNSASDTLIWSDQSREEFMDLMRDKWFRWAKLAPSKFTFNRILSFNIGHHIPFRKTLELSLEKIPNDRPYQIFMHSEDIKVDHTLYIHSPYTINLDKPESVPMLESQLKIADSIGSPGVVVHCAKGENSDNMYANLKKIDMKKYKTTLLVETSAGQGSEVLSNPAELNAFIEKLDDPQIRVCLDTCHVFAAGYNIIEALSILKRKVALVHYNNSRRSCGSKVDRHSHIVGHIDGRTMYRFASICDKLKIPMIIE